MKSGFVSILGKPNAGKSTILNALIGEKVAAVSNKPQTTRNKIMGVLTNDDVQMVFLDVPGIHKPKTKLGNKMMQCVKDSLDGVDVILAVVEPTDSASDFESIFGNLENYAVILVVNKIDLIEKELLLLLFEEYSKIMNFKAIIPVSAINNNGISEIYKEIVKLLDEGPMYYPEDMLTDQTEKLLVEEIIREKALRCLNKEVPHGIFVEVNKFKRREDKEIIDINANIYCEKKTHKGIIIGNNGSMLKRIGSRAREDIEKRFDIKINLKLWVKVREDWRNSDQFLKEMGY